MEETPNAHTYEMIPQVVWKIQSQKQESIIIYHLESATVVEIMLMSQPHIAHGESHVFKDCW